MSSNTNEIVKEGLNYRRLGFPRKKAALYLSVDLWAHFHSKFGHKKRTRQFPYHQNLLNFLQLNPAITIFFSELEEHKPFVVKASDYFVNIDSYIDFCQKIETQTEGRAQAFFGQLIDYSTVLTPEQRSGLIGSASSQELQNAIRNLSEQDRRSLIDEFSGAQKDFASESQSSFISRIDLSTKDYGKRNIIISKLPQVQLETLKGHRTFLLASLDKNETLIQNWIDGKVDNNGNETSLPLDEVERLRRSRCLIFGLDFINHKREGSTSQKRFDILARVADGRNEYVIIELKSPKSDVFKIETKVNRNGKTTTYALSDDVARAIPQISSYKGTLKNGTSTEWQSIGLPKGEIVKSIILVGKRPGDDPVWNDHYLFLKQDLSNIEIMTYTELLEKLDSTIKNLEENL